MTPLAVILIGLFAFMQDKVNPQAAVLQDFEKRIGDYVSQEKNLSKGISPTKQTTEPQTIIDRQHELAQRIRDARRDAKQGDIFSPEIAKEFHRLIGIALQGQNKADVKKSLARAEPVQLPLHVNDSWPSNIPLQSTPPSILLNLPRLPQELEYRITGHALVLRDTAANIVVDLIPDAIP